ncbi:hypothetical protein HK405_012024, partial [Cladochytrium tenue]
MNLNVRERWNPTAQDLLALVLRARQAPGIGVVRTYFAAGAWTAGEGNTAKTSGTTSAHSGSFRQHEAAHRDWILNLRDAVTLGGPDGENAVAVAGIQDEAGCGCVTGGWGWRPTSSPALDQNGDLLDVAA